MLRFKKLSDSDSGMMLVSNEFSDSDWPVRFVIRVMYTDYYDSEWTKTAGKYHVEVHATSFAACGKKEIDRASESASEDIAEMSPEWQAVALVEYGTSANLWQKTGNNLAELLKSARKELALISMLFGFYMDKPLNAIGSTGWDWIRGDILAGLKTANNDS